MFLSKLYNINTENINMFISNKSHDSLKDSSHKIYLKAYKNDINGQMKKINIQLNDIHYYFKNNNKISINNSEYNYKLKSIEDNDIFYIFISNENL